IEPDDPPRPITTSPINPSMGPNYQAIQIIDESRVARCRASNCEIRSGPPVDAAQLAHFFAMQLTQSHTIEKLQQLLEPLPDVLALVDEAIDRHVPLPIADFRFQISDFQSRIIQSFV